MTYPPPVPVYGPDDVILTVWFGNIKLEGTYEELFGFWQILLRDAMLEAGVIPSIS